MCIILDIKDEKGAMILTRSTILSRFNQIPLQFSHIYLYICMGYKVHAECSGTFKFGQYIRHHSPRGQLNHFTLSFKEKPGKGITPRSIYKHNSSFSPISPLFLDQIYLPGMYFGHIFQSCELTRSEVVWRRRDRRLGARNEDKRGLM